jgi:hypothetical protein
MPDPKGIMAIIGKGSPSLEGEGPESDAEPEDPKMAAAQQAMDAFDSGDVAALNEALSAHYRACVASEGEEMPEMETEEEYS